MSSDIRDYAAMGCRISEPGLYRMTAEAYHADPVIEPSLSSSIARVMLERSPLHASLLHPRLAGGDRAADKSRAMEIGSVAHRLLLGRGADIVVIKAKDYKGGEAQRKRAEATLDSLLPILQPDMETAEAMASAARRQLVEIDGIEVDFDDGDAEVVAVWREGSVWCRSMLDWLSPDRRLILDYKTSGEGAHPSAVVRRLFGTGADVQDAFYRRGLAALGHRAELLFVAQETSEPFEISAVCLDFEGRDIGDAKVSEAITQWTACTTAGSWPGYPRRVATADTPVWHRRDWEDRMLAGRALADLQVQQDAPRQLAGWAP